MLCVELTADADTCSFEIWGHPEKGDMEFVASYDAVGGKQTSDDGVYADTITLVDAGAYPVTPFDHEGSDRKSILTFDGKGLSDLYIWVTAFSSTTASFLARTY